MKLYVDELPDGCGNGCIFYKYASGCLIGHKLPAGFIVEFTEDDRRTDCPLKAIDENVMKRSLANMSVSETRVFDSMLSVRTRNALVRAGIETIGDITTIGAKMFWDLRGIRNFGETCSCETLEQMYELGFVEWAHEIAKWAPTNIKERHVDLFKRILFGE